MSKNKQLRFERAQVEVDMRSEGRHIIILNRITPPEYLMLKAVHGPHAVKYLEAQGHDIQKRMDETGKWLKKYTTQQDLAEKLELKYGVPTLEKVFPGANKVFPYTFEAVGAFSDEAEETAEPASEWIPMEDDELDEADEKSAPAAKKPEAQKDDEDLIGAGNKAGKGKQ